MNDIHTAGQMVEPPALRVDQLETQFFTREGVVRAVDGVSFEVRRGEIIGIVGESGSGKSVTALSLMGLLPKRHAQVVNGSIRLGEDELVGMSERGYRTVRGNRMAMIFQEPMTSLNPVLTIGFQLSEAIRVHNAVPRKAARDRALQMLQLVRVPDPERRLRQFPFELSGGMRQRVMIAMALACEPEVLIADEATTALDVTIQAQILELILELRDRLGTATIMITHDLGVVAETCDRVAVMYSGRLCESGTVRQVFEDPKHPYTQGLLQSIPRLPVGRSAPGPRKLTELPGNVPSAGDHLSGCRFAARCKNATSECSAATPPLVRIEKGRSVSCFKVSPAAKEAT